MSGVGVRDGATVEPDVGVAVAVGADVSDGGVVAGGEVSAAGAVGVGVAVAAWSAGAAQATPTGPVSRAKLEGIASAASPARRTNARRVIRRSHTRVILAVRRVTV